MPGGNTFRGQRDRVAAMRRDHPQSLFVLVLLQHSRSHRVRDPLPVRANLRLRHIAYLEKVVNGDRARSLLRCLLRKSWNGGENKETTQKTPRTITIDDFCV